MSDKGPNTTLISLPFVDVTGPVPLLAAWPRVPRGCVPKLIWRLRPTGCHPSSSLVYYTSSFPFQLDLSFLRSHCLWTLQGLTVPPAQTAGPFLPGLAVLGTTSCLHFLFIPVLSLLFLILVILKCDHVSKSPGRLVKVQIASPSPFLIQQDWVGPKNSHVCWLSW